MARLPKKITYKFYGPGIPEHRAIKWLTIHNLKAQSSRVDTKRRVLVMNFSMRKQRHVGILLLKLLYWLHDFCSAEKAWFYTVKETA